MVNRYSRSTLHQGQLYTPPLEIIGGAMEQLQKRYDTNFAIGEQVKNNFIQSLPQDRELANSLQKQYEEKVNNIVSKYNGDYSQANKDLQKLLYEIKKDYGPGGVANAIVSNYNNYANWQKESQDLIEKGKVLGDDFNLAHNYYMKTYKGIGNVDPVTGAYNRLTPETLTEAVDKNKIISDTFKDVRPIKYKVGRTEFKNGLKTDIIEEREGVTPDRLQAEFIAALNGNPKLAAYEAQKAKFAGRDPESIYGQWEDIAINRAQELAYMNTSDTRMSDRDPLFLLHERARLKKKEDEDLLSAMKSMYQYDPSVEATSRKQAKLDDTNWRLSGQPGRKEFGFSSSLGVELGYSDYSAPRKEGRFSNMTLRDAIDDKEFQASTNVIPGLAKAVLERNKLQLSKDPIDAEKIFNKNYGKNRAWTDEFDKRVVKDYKDQEASHSRMIARSVPVIDPAARVAQLKTLAGALGDPSSVQVYPVGSQAISTAADYGISAEDLADMKTGKIRPDRDNLAYVYPGAGYAAAGYRVNTDKGAFVIVDQNIDRQSMSNELAGGLNPIFFENKQSGNPIRIGADKQGKDIWAVPELKYLPDESGNIKEKLFVNPITFKDGKLVPMTYKNEAGNEVPWKQEVDINTIYNNYAPHFEGALGAGAKKQDRVLHTLYNYLNIDTYE